MNILNDLNFQDIDLKRFPITKILDKLPEKSSLFETVLVSINDILVKLFLVNDKFQLAKFIKKNMSGKKIVIGMGAGTISNWMRELPKLI